MKEYQSLLKGANNTRELSGVVNKSVFWRSGAPVSLTGEDVCLLHEKGFTTLVDMRSDPEVSLRPCMVRFLELFREKYHSADNYLASLGLSADEINMLRDKMMRY